MAASASVAVVVLPGTSPEHTSATLGAITAAKPDTVDLTALAFTPPTTPPDPWDRPTCGQLLIVGDDVGAVREWLPAIASLPDTTMLSLRLADGRGLVGRLSARTDQWLPLAVEWYVDTETGTVDVRFPSPAPTHATLVMLTRSSPLMLGGRSLSGARAVAADPHALPWLAGDAVARTLANAYVTWHSDNPDLVPYDVVLRTDPDDAESDSVNVVVGARCPPVDVVTVNPDGFLVATPRQPLVPAELSVVDGQASIGIDNETLRLRGDLRLRAGDIERLRRVDWLDAAAADQLPALAAARLLTQLAAGAVPCVARLTPQQRALLHPDLAALLEQPATADDEAREQRAVRAARLAFAHHTRRQLFDGTAAGWRATTGSDSVSALLVTMRPSFLQHAVDSLAAQSDVDLELVLVTHGFELSKSELAELRDRGPERMVVSSQPASTIFGAVMNHATGLASGRHIAKIDDDDWYGRWHLRDLLNAREWSGAVLIGAPAQYVYLADLDITVRRRMPAVGHPVRHVAGPTVLIGRDDLRQLGGWRPVPRAVDLSLSHAAREAGALLYETHGLGFMLCRHGSSHTWDPGTGSFLRGTAAQWRGFRLPPEIDDQELGRRHYDQVRQLADEPDPRAAFA